MPFALKRNFLVSVNRLSQTSRSNTGSWTHAASYSQQFLKEVPNAGSNSKAGRCGHEIAHDSEGLYKTDSR